MGDVYKVWVVVELCDEESDAYTELDSPFASTAVFENHDDAQAFALRLHEWGEAHASAGFVDAGT